MKRRLVLAAANSCKKRRPITLRMRPEPDDPPPPACVSIKQEEWPACAAAPPDTEALSPPAADSPVSPPQSHRVSHPDSDAEHQSTSGSTCRSRSTSRSRPLDLAQYLRMHVTHLYRCDLCNTVMDATSWPALELHFAEHHQRPANLEPETPQIALRTNKSQFQSRSDGKTAVQSQSQSPSPSRLKAASITAASPVKSATASSCSVSPSLPTGLSRSALLTLEMVQSIAGELRNRCSQCGEAFDSEMAVLHHQVKAHEVDPREERHAAPRSQNGGSSREQTCKLRVPRDIEQNNCTLPGFATSKSRNQAQATPQRRSSSEHSHSGSKRRKENCAGSVSVSVPVATLSKNGQKVAGAPDSACPFKCSVCGKTVESVSDYKLHEREHRHRDAHAHAHAHVPHEDAAAYKHGCLVCPLAAGTQIELQLHIRTHFGKKHALACKQPASATATATATATANAAPHAALCPSAGLATGTGSDKTNASRNDEDNYVDVENESN